MRVNLQYSVELNDVFKELTLLYTRRNDEILHKIYTNSQTLETKLGEESLDDSLKQVEALRIQLARFDSTLADIGAMLEGYERVMAQQVLQKQTEETYEQLSETNESGEDRQQLQPE